MRPISYTYETTKAEQLYCLVIFFWKFPHLFLGSVVLSICAVHMNNI